MVPCDLTKQVVAVLTRHVKPGQRLVVGLSGGVDSVALLTLLDELRHSFTFHLAAHHVNHQISLNAHDWASFCAGLCEARAIGFTQGIVEVPRDGGKGLEAAARAARHGAFAQLPADFVVLAHQQDDQAETLLLRLLRGTGVKGLGAMEECAALPAAPSQAGSATPRLLRPLLHVPRSVLLDYARAKGLKWIDDESNADAHHTRNYLRAQVLPRIEARFPAYRAVLDSMAAHSSESARLLDALAAIDAATAVSGGQLAVEALAALDSARAANLLRFWLAQHRLKMPDRDRLREMLRQVTTARPDAAVRMDHDGIELRRFHGKLYAVRPLPQPKRELCVFWSGRLQWEIPAVGGAIIFSPCTGAGLPSDALQSSPVSVRLRQGGERLRLAANRPPQTLKNLLQAGGIPPWERGRLPLLYIGERLAWVPSVGMDAAFQAGPGAEGLIPAWFPGNVVPGSGS
jgi:tRNA(Ile)-lysidine synthase